MKTKSIDFCLAMKRVRSGKCPVCGRKQYKSLIIQNHIKTVACHKCGSAGYQFYGLSGFEIFDGSHKGEKRVIINISEILQAVLSQKKILPALIGIDEGLDVLIAERLKV